MPINFQTINRYEYVYITKNLYCFFSILLYKHIVQSHADDHCALQSEALCTKRIGPSSERVFLDTIIRDTSLSALQFISDESDDEGSAHESGDDVYLESYDGSSSECEEQVQLSEIEELNISYNEYFIAHNTGNMDDVDTDSTQAECIDMEITSELEPATILCNVPIMSEEQQRCAEGINPTERLLSENYCDNLSNNLGEELTLVNDKKFVCSTSKIKELFSFCMDISCNMPLVEVKENFVGCVLEIRWRCKAGHVGDWQSSKAVQQVYVNNIQAASALLFTGNNFVKLSLFAKCFQLAFFCSSTFHKYQKKFLAVQIHSWWNAMQTKMFASLGDQTVIASGDGQMDSPGYSAKNCTYTVMHAELDYVLHVEVVDVRHSQLKSVVMEKVGCQRALDYLMGRINIVEFVTDASSQIIKLLGNFTIYSLFCPLCINGICSIVLLL